MKKALIYFLLIFTINSCDTVTNFSKTVVNDSSFDLMIVRSIGLDVSDTIILLQNQRKVLLNSSAMNRPLDNFTDCNFEQYYAFSDSINVYLDSSHHVLLDPNNNTNWQYIEISRNKMVGSGTCECILTILDEHVE